MACLIQSLAMPRWFRGRSLPTPRSGLKQLGGQRQYDQENLFSTPCLAYRDGIGGCDRFCAIFRGVARHYAVLPPNTHDQCPLAATFFTTGPGDFVRCEPLARGFECPVP